MLNKALLRSKFKALGLHLFLSLAVALSVAYVVFFLWYPNPFGFASGGLQLFLLVTCVDLVLGPTLTFVVFNPQKRRLLMVGDFIVIGMLQIAALVYGVHAVFDSRPVAVVFEGWRFRAVRAGELTDDDLKKAPRELAKLSVSGPKLIATRVLTAKEESDSIFVALGGKDIGARPEFWVPYEKELSRIAEASQNISVLLKRYPEAQAEITEIASQRNLKLDQLGFFPVLSKQGIFTMLVNKQSGAFVGYILLDGSL